MPRDLSPDLLSWSDVEEEHRWQGLLTGNGLSRSVWEGFSYGSLFEVATSTATPRPLSAADRALFDSLRAESNFEAVLSGLLTAKTVCDTLGLPSGAIEGSYNSIRDALVAAVHAVHIPWVQMQPHVLADIRNEIARYEWVFSTNYDLLIYWAIMSDPTDIKDFLWSIEFDPLDVEVWDDATKVLYLHGGLHLYRDMETGGTFKEVAVYGENLLDRFGKRPNTVPLCITEGTAEEKLSAIARSDYLRFALDQLRECHGPIVVVGQGLGESDAHLASVLARVPDRSMAVGIFPGSKTHVQKEKARFWQLFPLADLYFFNSTTHPLSSPTLRITP